MIKKSNIHEDFIRFTQSNGEKNIKGNFRVFTFQDEETKQIITYSPSLDMSGFGDTKEEALEMFHDTVLEYLKTLAFLATKKRDAELIRLGWSKEIHKSKVFKPKFDVIKKVEDQGITEYNESVISLKAA